MDSKKILAGAATGALIGAMALTGCGGSNSVSARSASSPEVNATSNSASSDNVASSNASNQASDAGAVSPSTTIDNANASASSAATSSGSADSSQYIGVDEAKEIALTQNGCTAASVTDLEVELDTDESPVHYDVEFKANGKKYDVEIDATNGFMSKVEVESLDD